MPKRKTNQPHTLLHYIFTVGYFFIKGLIESILWVFLGFGGFIIFQSKRSPYDIIIGLPLLLISIGVIVNDLWTDLLSIFSPAYNRGICILCHPE